MKMTAFIWKTDHLINTKIGVSRDSYLSFDPPCILNWPKSPHRLGLNIPFPIENKSKKIRFWTKTKIMFFISPKRKYTFYEDRLNIICYIQSWPLYDKELKKVFQTTFGIYRRSPHFVIFSTKRVSRNSGITNFETLFSAKSQIGSKNFLKSTFLANFSFFESQKQLIIRSFLTYFCHAAKNHKKKLT